MALPIIHTFRAVNTAAGSGNRIHDDQTAVGYGLAGAAVPAVALLAHQLDAAASHLGPHGSADIRLRRPVIAGQRIRVRAEASGEGGATVDLLADDDTVVVSGVVRPDGGLYRGDCPDLTADPVPARPLDTPALAADERLAPMAVDTSHQRITDLYENLGLRREHDVVPAAYLIAQFVPYLALNFVRQRPSMYVGVSLACRQPVPVDAVLEMRGRIDRIYRRRGRGFAVVETGWFGADGDPSMWATHTLMYARAEEGQREWP